jgi:hypothetical protein
LVFDPNKLSLSPSVTPFDSGAVVITRSGQQVLSLNAPYDTDRVEYTRLSVAECQASEGGWREAFALWLAAYYPNAPQEYWTNDAPMHVDPDGLYQQSPLETDSWGGWVWEVRYPDNVPLEACVGWSCSNDLFGILETALTNQPMTEQEIERISRFKARRHKSEALRDGDIEWDQLLTTWVMEKCGVTTT